VRASLDVAKASSALGNGLVRRNHDPGCARGRAFEPRHPLGASKILIAKLADGSVPELDFWRRYPGVKKIASGDRASDNLALVIAILLAHHERSPHVESRPTAPVLQRKQICPIGAVIRRLPTHPRVQRERVDDRPLCGPLARPCVLNRAAVGEVTDNRNYEPASRDEKRSQRQPETSVHKPEANLATRRPSVRRRLLRGRCRAVAAEVDARRKHAVNRQSAGRTLTQALT
jgi:hypothetical protein